MSRPYQGGAPGSFSPMPSSITAASSSMAAASGPSSPLPPPVPPKQPATTKDGDLPPPPVSKVHSHDDSLLGASDDGNRTTAPMGTPATGSAAASRAPSQAQAQSATSSSGSVSGILPYRPSSRGNPKAAKTLDPRFTPSVLPPPPPPQGSGGPPPPSDAIAASQIAAQTAAVRERLQQQQQQQRPDSPTQQRSQHQHQYLASHIRQRSQTVPGEDVRPPTSPPVVSLAEASVPPRQDEGFIPYRNGLPGSHVAAATAAANVAFPRVGALQSAYSLPASQQQPPLPPLPPLPSLPAQQPTPPPPAVGEKKVEKEKSRVKLFGIKISKGDPKDKPLPSPGTAKTSLLVALHRGNTSAISLTDASGSIYSLNNSSSATIIPYDPDGTKEKEKEKEKEKKHTFLSRNKRKHSKEEFHLPLSSAASNSRPTDPNAPSSLYNFSAQPSSPGPTATSFSKSGRRDKKGGGGDNDGLTEWPLMANSTGLSAQSNLFYESFDSTKYGLPHMSGDDAWPYLKAKLQAVFEGEDLRITVEDMNRVVALHLQYCLQRRTLGTVLDDLSSLLDLGFSSMAHTLQQVPEDRLIPILVEYWLYTFTTTLPTLQAIFLPLDLEFSGSAHAKEYLARKASASSQRQERHRTATNTSNRSASSASSLLSSSSSSSSSLSSSAKPASAPQPPPSNVGVDIVRRLILTSFRDRVVLPRYEPLKNIFSRLSLEFLPASLTTNALASPRLSQDAFAMPMPGSSPADSFLNNIDRPGTSLDTDRSTASYASLALNNDSTSSILSTNTNNHNNNNSSLNGGTASSNASTGASSGHGRSRAISNVSFSSASISESSFRPFTPSSLPIRSDSNTIPSSSNLATNPSGNGIGAGGSSNNNDNTAAASHIRCTNREQNIDEDSKQVTDMVGRMLQCMSVLTSLGVVGEATDEAYRRVDELCKMLKLNWLGRGRTGRNRRGIVGGRLRRDRERQDEGADHGG